MKLTNRPIAMVLCALLCAPAAPAQERKPEPQANPGSAPLAEDVTIIIQQQQVRFAARNATEEMRLQVFDPAGDIVYDSGVVAGPELNWPLRKGNGDALASGMYAYTLSIKEVGKEAGAEKARERRGHFIVDRAADRDNGADRLWITSHRADVGAELTVARDESVTVAGVTTNPERTAGRAAGSLKRDANGRAVEAEPGKQPDADRTAAAAAAAAPAGTAGRIVKYATAFDLGDSVITEQGGNIGIGITAPNRVLHVHSNSSFTPLVLSTGSGPEGAASFRLQADSGLGGQGRSFVIYDDIAQQYRMVINGRGQVGLGTPTPFGELHIAGFGPFITLESRQNGSKQAYIQNADGNLVFKPAGFGACCAAMVIKPNTGNVEFTGNVGIGTSNPATRLQVEGAGPVEASIVSRNDRAVLSLGNTIGPARYVWTLESGLYGSAGLFGIYNPLTKKSGLEIDGNMLVSVKALQITGGADFSEKFDVLAAKVLAGKGAEDIRPGMVVAIDPAHPGKLNLSRRAYDRRVAGIISGAGGVRPGMMMGQEGTPADGSHPVALSGRVYVWVDASRGAVKPGDLLTTSATPGHAMKAARPSKAQGAILGKAMTGLKSGKGLVLVLVTLQ